MCEGEYETGGVFMCQDVKVCVCVRVCVKRLAGTGLEEPLQISFQLASARLTVIW